MTRRKLAVSSSSGTLNSQKVSHPHERSSHTSRHFLLSLSCCALFILFSSASLLFFHARYRALTFRPDFALYLQFAARVFTPEPSYSFHVRGDNFLAFVGWEGEKSIHQSLHLEPIKYFDGLLYYLFSDVRFLFIWRVVLFFLPVLYIPLLAQKKPLYSNSFFLLLGVVYLIYPSSLFAVTYDLRPYSLLAPLIFLLYMSIQFHRPVWETVLWMNLSFLVREEALVFTLVAILYLLARDGYEKRSLHKATFLGVNWLLWLLTTLAYFRWTEYPNLRNWPAWTALLTGISIAGLLFYRRWHKLRSCIWTYKSGLVLASALPPIAYQFARELVRGDVRPWDLLVHPRWYLFVPCVLVLVVWLRDQIQNTRGRQCLLVLLAFVGAMSLTVTIGGREGAIQSFLRYRASAEAASLVFHWRDRLAARSATVLCDYWTCQAFADHERMVHLGSALGKRGFKKYPEADGDFLVHDSVDSVVVRTDSLPQLEEALTMRPEQIICEEATEGFHAFSLDLNKLN